MRTLLPSVASTALILSACGSSSTATSGATGGHGGAAHGAGASSATSAASAGSTAAATAGATATTAATTSSAAATSSTTAGTGGAGCGPGAPYDEVVLCDHPVGYWAMNGAPGSEVDLTGNQSTGTYHGTPSLASMPNGDMAADFDGASQYLSIPSSAAFSIPTTGSLTWEGWIRPDVLQYPHQSSDGYIDWMGKCDSYAPSCEWEARMYSTNNPQGRCNRLSAYAFNPMAGLGSGADWQPACGLFQAGQWLHVVGEYTTQSQPTDCPDDPAHPGSLAIWVNGVPWDQAVHSPTGCMSQYQVVPKAGGSTLDVGTMAFDTWFAGAVGKVAVYGYLLTQAQISHHYQAMTGSAPTGSCASTCTL